MALDTRGFSDGFMQGFGLVDNYYRQNKADKRADEEMAMGRKRMGMAEVQLGMERERHTDTLETSRQSRTHADIRLGMDRDNNDRLGRATDAQIRASDAQTDYNRQRLTDAQREAQRQETARILERWATPGYTPAEEELRFMQENEPWLHPSNLFGEEHMRGVDDIRQMLQNPEIDTVQLGGKVHDFMGGYFVSAYGNTIRSGVGEGRPYDAYRIQSVDTREVNGKEELFFNVRFQFTDANGAVRFMDEEVKGNLEGAQRYFMGNAVLADMYRQNETFRGTVQLASQRMEQMDRADAEAAYNRERQSFMSNLMAEYPSWYQSRIEAGDDPATLPNQRDWVREQAQGFTFDNFYASEWRNRRQGPASLPTNDELMDLFGQRGITLPPGQAGYRASAVIQEELNQFDDWQAALGNAAGVLGNDIRTMTPGDIIEFLTEVRTGIDGLRNPDPNAIEEVWRAAANKRRAGAARDDRASRNPRLERGDYRGMGLTNRG